MLRAERYKIPAQQQALILYVRPHSSHEQK